MMGMHKGAGAVNTVRRRLMQAVGAGLVLPGGAAVLAPAAWATDFPTKPIRLVVPYAPGGIADTMSRKLAEALRDEFQQTVLVDNKPGANTVVGAVNVAAAAPDGYSLLLAVGATMVLNPLLVANLRYQPKDLAAVAQVAATPLVILVSSASPIQNLADLVRAAKAEPGKLAVASTGTGSTTHLAAELLQAQAGIRLNHIPYNGSAPSLNAVMSGDVQLSVDAVASAIQLAKGGKLRPIAVTTAERVGVLPQVPTLAESGLPGVDVSAWYGVVAPAQTPMAIRERLNAAIVKATSDKAFREPLEALGLVVARPHKVQDFETAIEKERGVWTPLVKAKNIRLD